MDKRETIGTILVIVAVIIFGIVGAKYASMRNDERIEGLEQECIDDCQRAGQGFFKIKYGWNNHCTCMSNDGELTQIW